MLTAEKENINKIKQVNPSVGLPNKMASKEVFQNEQFNRLFPVFLKMENLNTLIIGGGSVGLEKLSAVLRNSPDANVTLVAPSIKEEILELIKQHQRVQLIQREFEESDFENKDVIISAANDRDLNLSIRNKAKEKKILINVADTPELCDFYLGSVVQKGSVKIAISTNGKSPTIAKRFREILHDAIPDEMENILDNLVKIRSRLNGTFSNKVKALNKITSVLVEDLSDSRYELKKKINLQTSYLFQYLLIVLEVLLIMVFTIVII